MTGLWVAWVLGVTLYPDSGRSTVNLVPLREHGQAVHCLLSNCSAAGRAARFLIVDVLGNWLVFLPIGFSLAGALGNLPGRRRLQTAIALAAVLSVSIELMQLAIPNRTTDVDDVLFNTMGAATGAVFMMATQHWVNYGGD